MAIPPCRSGGCIARNARATAMPIRAFSTRSSTKRIVRALPASAKDARRCVSPCPARSRSRSSPPRRSRSPAAPRNRGQGRPALCRARRRHALFGAAQGSARSAGSTSWRRALFDEVERQHPYSIWARRAQLMSAFSYYLDARLHQVDPVGAALPLGPSRQPRRALCLLSDRARLLRADQRRHARPEDHAAGARCAGRTDPALSQFALCADARLKIDLVRDHLAGKEMEIGRFYETRGQWLAASLRFRRVIDEYQTTTHVPEALMRLTETYLALGVPDEAQKAAAVLGANYPGTRLVPARLQADAGASAARRRGAGKTPNRHGDRHQGETGHAGNMRPDHRPRRNGAGPHAGNRRPNWR